jgi:hypothetical protein
LPPLTPIVDKKVLFKPVPLVLVTWVAPSLITCELGYLNKGFKVAKLLVGVSVAWSAAVMFVSGEV